MVGHLEAILAAFHVEFEVIIPQHGPRVHEGACLGGVAVPLPKDNPQRKPMVEAGVTRESVDLRQPGCGGGLRSAYKLSSKQFVGSLLTALPNDMCDCLYKKNTDEYD